MAARGLFWTPQWRGGRAPLRGVGELRPLEVSRQPPDFFPGIRHHRLLAEPRKNSGHVNPKAAGACAERAARRDKRRRPGRRYGTRESRAGGGGQKSRSSAHPVREVCPLRYEPAARVERSLLGHLWVLRSRQGCGWVAGPAKLVKYYFSVCLHDP